MKHDHEASFLAAQARTNEIHSHIRSVLRKYPKLTVPDELKWALILATQMLFYVGTDTVQVVVETGGYELKGQFPRALLNAPQQEIHAWTRGQYWAHQRRQKDAERRATARKLVSLERAAVQAQKELERARALTAK